MEAHHQNQFDAGAAMTSPLERRAEAALAGHTGDVDGARAATNDADGRVRATALGALARLGVLEPDDLIGPLADPDPSVRRRACELAATLSGPDLIPLLADPDPFVAEMAAWALGERGESPDPATDVAIAALSEMVRAHEDPLCREAAVAALGAIGMDGGLPAILLATADRPAVRRRAVLALAPFSGPEVDAALARALTDRDWQVRQAAEDLTED